MKNAKRFIVVLLCLLALLPALSISAHNGPHVRFVHLAAPADPVDIYAAGELVARAVKYKDTTNYLALEEASVDFVITPAGGKITDSLTAKPVTLSFSADEGKFFTVAIIGSAKDKTLELLKLPADKGTSGEAPAAAATDDHADDDHAAVGSATVGNITVTGAFARPTVAGTAPATKDAMAGMNMGGATPDAMAGMNMGGAATKEAMAGMNMAAANSAAYMTIQNTGDKADKLVSVSCEIADAQIHQTTVKDGVASMQHVDGVDVPAKGTAELKPGGYHVMLMQLKQGLVAGQTLKLTLTFQSGTKVTVVAAIRMS